jgi:hypothetical protein
MWNQVFDELERSATQMALSIAHVLPGVAVMLIAILLAIPVGWVLCRTLRQVLTKLHFDEKISHWGFRSLIAWSPSNSPTELVSRTVYWLVILFSFLIGLTALDANLPSRLSLRALEYIPNLLVALLILAAGAFIARHLAEGVLISAVNMQLQSARLVSLGVKWLILVMTAAMVMEHLGIGGAIVRLAFCILFGGIVLAMALAVGLGSKDVVSKSWERRDEESEEEPSEPFRHL